MNRVEVFNGVRQCLAQALDVPADSIREGDRMIDDLGADSLDLLDLVFQLEQQFRIRIPIRDIERRAREKLGGGPLDVEGVYTAEALAELRAALPEVPPPELADGLTTADLPRRFRVATMVNLVTRVLEGRSA